MNKYMHLLWIVVLLAASGCRIVDAPKGYVELDDPPRPYDFKAVSPDDCRFTVRVVDNEGDGTLDFWEKAIRNQLMRNKGYEFLSGRDPRTGGGLDGKELLFGTSSKGVDYRYLVGIFPYTSWLPTWLYKKKIYLVEAGGEKDTLEADLEALRRAMLTLR